MKNSDVMDIINEIESKFPVESWRVGHMHVWPLIRINWAYALIRSDVVRGCAVWRKSEVRVLGNRAREVVRGIWRLVLAMAKDRKNSADPRKTVDVVLLSDGASLVKIEGAWYDRFCQPFAVYLDGRGLSHLTLTPGREYKVPRYYASCFVQNSLDLLRAKSNWESFWRKELDLKFNGFDEFGKFVEACGFDVPVPTKAWVFKEANRVFRASQFFKAVLKANRARHAFIVSYYWTEGLGFNLACWQLGIPSIDIQHGIQGEEHFAYGRWTRMPEEGYNVMPSYFWVWSEAEAAAINCWRRHISGRHEPIVGGDLWLHQWVKGELRVMRECDEKIMSLGPKGYQTKHLLVTLQFGVFASERVLSALLNAMEKSPAEWQWWVRLHPCMLSERKQIKNMLLQHGIRNFNLDDASDLPLYALLRHMDVHITHSSSSVIEAHWFGVPSIIISDYGADLYKDQLGSGQICVALTSEEILNKIATSSKDISSTQESRKSELSRRVSAGLNVLDGMFECMRR